MLGGGICDPVALGERSRNIPCDASRPRGSAGKRGRSSLSSGRDSSASPRNTTGVKKRAVGKGVTRTPRRNTSLSSNANSNTADPLRAPSLGNAASRQASEAANAAYLESLLGASPIPSPGQVPGRNSRTVPNREAGCGEIARMNFEQGQQQAPPALLPAAEFKKKFYVRRVEGVGSEELQCLAGDRRRRQQPAKPSGRRGAAEQGRQQQGQQRQPSVRSPELTETPVDYANRVSVDPAAPKRGARQPQPSGSGAATHPDANSSCDSAQACTGEEEAADPTSGAPEGAFVFQQVGRRVRPEALAGRGGGGGGELARDAPSYDAVADETLRAMYFMDSHAGHTARLADDEGFAAQASARRGEPSEGGVPGGGPAGGGVPAPGAAAAEGGAGEQDRGRYQASLRGVFFQGVSESHLAQGGVLHHQMSHTSEIETRTDAVFRKSLAGKRGAQGGGGGGGGGGAPSRRLGGVSTVVPNARRTVVPLGEARLTGPAFRSALAGVAPFGSSGGVAPGCMDIAPGLRRKQRNTRVLPQVADRVLDAPCVVDDYRMQTIDWSEWANVMAVCLNDTIYTWDATTGVSSELLSLEDELNAVASVRWIQHGLVLAFGCSSNGIARVWDVTKGRQLRQMPGHSDRICSLAWNEHILTTGSRDGTITHHDVRVKNHVVATFPLVAHPLYSSEVCNIVYSPDFSCMAASNAEGVVSLFDATPNAAGNKPLRTMKLHNGPVKALSWVPDRRHCFVTGGYQDRILKVTKASSTPETLFSTPTEANIVSCLWSRHSSELVTCSGSPTNAVTVYGQTKQCGFKKLGDIRAHGDRVLHMTMSADGQTVVTSAADETIRFWKLFEEPKKPRPLNTLAIR